MSTGQKCKAKSSRTGEQCKAWAIKGGEVCHLLERPDLMEIAGLTRYNALEVSEADGALTSRRLLARSRAAYWRKKGAS